MPHPIRLHPKRNIQSGLGNVLKIIRPVFARGAVQIGGANSLHGLEVVVVEVLAAVEHEVLEKVGKAALAGLLVFRADVIPHVDRHDRRFAILVHDDRQTIWQYELLEWDVDLHSRWRSLRNQPLHGGTGEEHDECQRCECIETSFHDGPSLFRGEMGLRNRVCWSFESTRCAA